MADGNLGLTVPEAVATHLGQVYGLKVFTQVPQGFERPCFVIRLIESTSVKLNAHRRQIRNFVSMTYHGRDSQENWRMAADLLEKIELIPLEDGKLMRAYDKTSVESDGSLVTTAWYNYEIVEVPEVAPMEKLETNIRTEDK